MEKNNGKIAIAIVAMFVVALSVVGFTYAYFVARVQGNTNTKSVTVTAGTLSVEYTAGTQVISARNLVPGWQSDEKHFFDSAKYTDVNGEIRYTACVVGDTNTDTKCDDSKAIEDNGITKPATFTVTNNSTARDVDSEVSYVVILNGISNGLYTVDSDPKDANDTDEEKNLYYALCKGTCPVVSEYADFDDDSKNIDETNVIKRGNVATTNVQVISDVRQLDKNNADATLPASESYELMLYYAETDTKQNGTGKTVTAKVDIIGVAQAENGAWYDANGVEIIPAS